MLFYFSIKTCFLFFILQCFFLIFRFFSEHLYVKKRHTLNANWQSIVVVLIIKKYCTHYNTAIIKYRYHSNRKSPVYLFVYLFINPHEDTETQFHKRSTIERDKTTVWI